MWQETQNDTNTIDSSEEEKYAERPDSGQIQMDLDLSKPLQEAQK